MAPRVSFVIPAYNAEAYIGRCLQSIARQTVAKREYEVVIIDNGSTDNTHEIIHSYGLTYTVMPGATVGALRNRGAALARGEFLAFVDSDVELGPTWFEAGVRTIHQQNIVACGCFPKAPPNPTWVQRAWEIHQCKREKIGKISKASWLPSMNLLVRRVDFWAVGGFHESLATAEDVDLCYRLRARGTILHNPAMEAIHWGEAPDLVTFWHKEVWRGTGNLEGMQLHGLRLDELASLGYPLYMLGILILLMGAIFADVSAGQFHSTLLTATVLMAPALLLAVSTGFRTNTYHAIGPLFMLYLVYGIARAYSVSKEWVRGMLRKTA